MRNLIYDYLKKYQDDPTSRVFAPLAEAYRKAGMIDEAIEVSREGLRVHPRFIGGRVALARALFDKKLYEEVIQELGPIIHDAPDNLIAQKLLAESFLMVGRVTEALGCYKMLLYYTPTDPEMARLVQELEAEAYDQGTLVLRTDPPKPEPLPEFSEKSLSQSIDEDPGLRREHWIRGIEKLQEMLLAVERYRIRG